MAFNEKLKELRTGQNLTQKEFAQKIGLSAASVIAYERNEKKPSFDVLLSIAEQFDVSLDWLCRDRPIFEHKIEKWSDYLRLIYPLLHSRKVPIFVEKNNNSWYDMVTLNIPKNLICSLNPNIEGYSIYECYEDKNNDAYHFENPIYEFITAHEKMFDLVTNDSISMELFFLWLNEEYKKNDKPVWNPDLRRLKKNNGND